MTLAALLLGGDDFQRSVMIAASAGFDTDSNAGVVGCVNGIRLRDGTRRVLAEAAFSYRQDSPYTCELACSGNRVTFGVNGERVAAVTDSDHAYRNGSAGFLVDTGTMLADGFVIRATTGEAAA